MIALMYDGLELGVFSRDTNGKLHFHKHENVAKTWLPYIFEIHLEEDMDAVTQAWIKERIFPKNRLDSRKLLKQLGLKTYDANKIAEITRCSLVTDPYWIAYTEDDTFSNSSVRGKMKNEDYPYNSINIKNEGNYKWRI